MKKEKKNLTFDMVRALLHQEEEENKKLKEELKNAECEF
jgi:hypothetical protein